MQITHENMVSNLVKSGETILEELTPVEAHIIHMMMGLSGETGELLDAFKKMVIYRKPLDRVNVVEELGDIEFYLEGLRQALDITRDETLEANIAKLRVRYEGFRYSDKNAIERADK